MNESKLILSIVTATYNRTNQLKKNYKFIKKKSLIYKFEWIILYEKHDIKTKIFLQNVKDEFIKKVEVNYRDADKAYMHGFKLAKGKYLTIHGDDDYFESENFKNIFIALKSNKEWVIGQSYYVNDNNIIIRKFTTKVKNFLLFLNPKIFLPLVNYVMTPSVFFKKKTMIKVGGYDGDCKFAPDYIFWLKFSKFFAAKIVHKNLSRVTFNSSTKTASFSFKRYLIFLKYMKEYANSPIIRILQIKFTFMIAIYNFIVKKIIKIY